MQALATVLILFGFIAFAWAVSICVNMGNLYIPEFELCPSSPEGKCCNIKISAM